MSYFLAILSSNSNPFVCLIIILYSCFCNMAHVVPVSPMVWIGIFLWFFLWYVVYPIFPHEVTPLMLRGQPYPVIYGRLSVNVLFLHLIYLGGKMCLFVFLLTLSKCRDVNSRMVIFSVGICVHFGKKKWNGCRRESTSTSELLDLGILFGNPLPMDSNLNLKGCFAWGGAI